MIDLEDGVSKLTEFSTVLSSVTRTLDKNVRRLEDQFGKCNSAFKEMKVLVDAQGRAVDTLVGESDEQKRSILAAVTATAEIGQPIPPSKFLTHELDAIIRLDAAAMVADPTNPFEKIKAKSNTPARVAVDQAVNDSLHKLNYQLFEEWKKIVEKGTVYNKRITRKSTPAQVIGALVQRMYEAENAISLQSSINEQLVKALRDDTYLRNSHNHLEGVCQGIHEELRGMKQAHGELVKTVHTLSESVSDLKGAFEKHKEATADVVPGGRLRVTGPRRLKLRLKEINPDYDGPDEDEVVEDGLDAFTLEESERMLSKVLHLERSIFGPTGLEPKVAGLDERVDEVGAEMKDLRQSQTEIKEWQEALANKLKYKIADTRTRWDVVLGDINFCLNTLSNELAKDLGLSGGGPDELAAKSVFVDKLGMLYDSVTATLDFFNTNNRTEDETLDLLCPRLDVISRQAEELLKLDADIKRARLPHHAQDSDKEGGEGETKNQEPSFAPSALDKGIEGGAKICFADMPHVNRFNHTLQESIVAAVAESVGVLDRRIGKVTLQRALEGLRKDKVGRGEFDKMKTAVKKSKADHKALVVDVDKKATKAELKRLRDAVYTGGTLSPSNSLHSPTQSITDDPSVESLSDMLGEGEDGYFGAQQYFDRRMQQQGMAAGPAGGATVVDAASAAALNDLTMRLDLLVKQFKDVTDLTLPTLVPREEVHEALQAVLHEIKLVKLNTINVNRFKQGLDTKADAEEVKRLVETLNQAVGDMMGTNVAAAGKLRCLLCDKPVGSVVKDVEKRDRGRSLSPQSHGHSSLSVVDESPNYRPGSSSSSVGTGANRSSPSKLEHAKQARITSELSVLRNSIDLPLMDPSIAQTQQSSVSQPKDLYKQRIRASGGGGFGANYTENTR